MTSCGFLERFEKSRVGHLPGTPMIRRARDSIAEACRGDGDAESRSWFECDRIEGLGLLARVKGNNVDWSSYVQIMDKTT